MPRDQFSRDLEQLGDADVNHVQALAKKYRTSLEATSNRYTDLTADICAFVFSKDGVIRYIRPTSNFPRSAVKFGDSLPSGCASLRAPAQPLRVATTWAEVDGSVGLHTVGGTKSPKILEHTVRLKDGYQTSLLFVDGNAVEEDEEEEADLERSWDVRFHRR